jgi:hypothetical protein
MAEVLERLQQALEEQQLRQGSEALGRHYLPHNDEGVGETPRLLKHGLAASNNKTRADRVFFSFDSHGIHTAIAKRTITPHAHSDRLAMSRSPPDCQ